MLVQISGDECQRVPSMIVFSCHDCKNGVLTCVCGYKDLFSDKIVRVLARQWWNSRVVGTRCWLRCTNRIVHFWLVQYAVWRFSSNFSWLREMIGAISYWLESRMILLRLLRLHSSLIHVSVKESRYDRLLEQQKYSLTSLCTACVFLGDLQ